MFLGSSCIYLSMPHGRLVKNTSLLARSDRTNRPYALARSPASKCAGAMPQYGAKYLAAMPTNPMALVTPTTENSHVIPSSDSQVR